MNDVQTHLFISVCGQNQHNILFQHVSVITDCGLTKSSTVIYHVLKNSKVILKYCLLPGNTIKMYYKQQRKKRETPEKLLAQIIVQTESQKNHKNSTSNKLKVQKLKNSSIRLLVSRHGQ